MRSLLGGGLRGGCGGSDMKARGGGHHWEVEVIIGVGRGW